MGKKRSTQKKNAPDAPQRKSAPPAPLEERGYMLSSLKLFSGTVVLLAVGFAAGVLVQANLGPPTPAPSAAPQAHPQVQLDLNQSTEAIQAITRLESHLQHAPDDLSARIDLANALFDAERYSEAVPHYQMALETRPDNADIRTDLGICFRRSGDGNRAVAPFRRAIQDAPQHINAHFNLGVVLAYDLDDAAGAIAAWERFLELAPNAPNADQVRSAIGEMKAER